MTNEQQQPTTALVRAERLPIASITDLQQIGVAIAQSGMFGIANPGAGLVVAATCHSQGISLLEFARTYHIVQGRPSMRADAMLAEFRRRGGRVRIVENSVSRAAIKVEFEDQTTEWSFSMDDAVRTGDCFTGKVDKQGNPTLKDNWQKRPEDMLWARVVSRMVRRLCPEINAGTYTPEEAEDFQPRGSDAARVVVPITVGEAQARAGMATGEAIEPEVVDYSRCPNGFGEFSGRTWAEMDDDTLNAALGSALAGGYKTQIEATLDTRRYEASKGCGVKVYAIGTPEGTLGLGMWWGPNPDINIAMEQAARTGDVLVELLPNGEQTRCWIRTDKETWEEQKGGPS